MFHLALSHSSSPWMQCVRRRDMRDMRACPANGPEAPGEAFTQRNVIFLRSFLATGKRSHPCLVQICSWTIVATWSKWLLLGEAVFFMNCCCIVRIHRLMALLGSVTSAFETNPTSSSITVSILNLFFISLLLSLPVTRMCSIALSLLHTHFSFLSFPFVSPYSCHSSIHPLDCRKLNKWA